ncbi:hypothetical protein [Phytomonospora endophytica]|uniref:Uncharacterized protein n=1 Tax=Phytomonospora endophytica TaxID=714109 RepID=A0A841FUE7_9ACTN|nr:hypothetical protein [Phytomonospora endophytica]MBB6037172.1 hypothetical protein [Phytomonospora endophytica]GIG71212.1 hypothetical protein Pen01_75070 [Phytomonospora endophytica]
MAFPEGPVPAGTAVGGLGDRQRALVDVLASSPKAWLIGESSFGNFRMLVQGYGLPTNTRKCGPTWADTRWHE